MKEKDLDISKLELKNYKNYKEMCKVLNQKTKTGKAKQLQLKDWERYFSYKKEGHTFIVTDIKFIPDIKVDNRGYNGIYSECIDDVIMLLLGEEKDLTLETSFGILMSKVGLINPSFRICSRDVYATALVTGIEVAYIEHFFLKEYPKLRSVLKLSLKRLKDKGYIYMEENRMMIVPFDITVRIDADGRDLTDKQGIPIADIVERPIRTATTEEIEKILQLKIETAREMGFSNEVEVRYRNKGREFQKKLNIKLQTSMNILYCFGGVRIIKNRDMISNYIDSNSAKIELNKRIIENHIVSFENEFQNNEYRYWLSGDDVRTHDCFADTQKELLNSTVNIEYGCVIGEEVRDVRSRINKGEDIKFISKYNSVKNNNYMELLIEEYEALNEVM